jgi:hypothetical protein
MHANRGICGRMYPLAPLFFAVWVFGTVPAYGQEPVATDSVQTPISPVIVSQNPDTAHTPATTPFPTRPDTSFWQRPTGKLFKSVIFPGWGQYSNGKYQKAAIFFTLETYFIIKSVHYFQKTRDRFDIYQETKTDADFAAYDDAKDRRNKFYWYVAGTIFVSMWDAYADAHLKPFEEIEKQEDDTWGMDDRPDVSPPRLSLALTFRF